MLTVYFDTSFLVDLAAATEDDARVALDALNGRSVRVVFSRAIAFELLRNTAKPERDRALVERLARLNVAPYLTDPHINPIVLLASGPTRDVTAATLKAADLKMTEAFASRILATTDDEHPLREAADQKALDDVGIGDASMPDEERQRVAMAVVQARLDELAAAAAIVGVSLEEIVARVRTAEARVSHEREGAVMASVAGRTEQPYKLALGTISEKSRKKLANTIRDARHMVEFCEHASAIDLLQVDGPRYAQIENDQDHAMRLLGFRDRCFARPTLASAVEYVCAYGAAAP